MNEGSIAPAIRRMLNIRLAIFPESFLAMVLFLLMSTDTPAKTILMTRRIISPVNLKLVSIPGRSSMSAKSTACPRSTMSRLNDHVFLEDFFIWSKIRNPISDTAIKMSSKYAITIPAFACFEASIVNWIPGLNDS